MKKYFFVVFFVATLAFAQTPVEFRAMKLTNVDSDLLFSDQKIAEGMDYLASIGINLVLPVIWNSHGADGDYTLYPSAVMDAYFGKPVYPYFPKTRDMLRRVIIEAHRNGMEVLPWFEMGFSTSYSQNGGFILATYPDWALKDNTGKLMVKNGFDWMSAINPEVQEFMLALVTEVIDTYDVDGLEFSDRIPALPVEGGYDSVTVALYRSEHNGANPPANYKNSAWMRWRANKLNQFLAAVRDSVKARGEHLLVSSSPSVYPWSYEEYLQDSKTWVDQGIVDNLIPQLYRTNYGEYVYELDKSLGYHPTAKRDIFFSGILVYLRGDNYLITPDFLLKSVQANRARKVMGEAFFFYEGLRLNNSQLGTELKATFYSQPALLPHRAGKIWRPKGIIVNEDDPEVRRVGNWSESTISGFQGKILLKKDSEYGALDYYFRVPVSAWYNVLAYNVTGPLATDKAPYTLFSATDSVTVHLDQQSIHRNGWQILKPVFLAAGRHRVLRLDNRNVAAGKYVVADAAMIMINRKLSPEVVITPVAVPVAPAIPGRFELAQNYPNPFNASTKIRYHLPQAASVQLTVYDPLGRRVAELVNTYQSAGEYEAFFDGDGLSSGVYFYRLQTDRVNTLSQKMILLR